MIHLASVVIASKHHIDLLRAHDPEDSRDHEPRVYALKGSPSDEKVVRDLAPQEIANKRG